MILNSLYIFRVNEHINITGALCDQFVLRYIVKEFLKVNINYPFISVIEVFKQLDYRLFTSSIRTKAITVFAECRLKYGS